MSKKATELTPFSSRKKAGQSRPKMDSQAQIDAIEKEIRETPYHKGTQRHIGILRARIAKLKDQDILKASKGGGGGIGYAVKKQGNATIVLVGPPSVGKSTLLNRLTNAKSKVAPYAFTTLTVIPGMMKYKDTYIQILDVPGLIKGAEEGKGRGREVLSVIRGADLLLIMTDPKNLDAFKSISNALERNGIRINKTKPDVTIEKGLTGGISVHTNLDQDFGNEMVADIASQFGFKNGNITIRQKLTVDELIDTFSANRVYIPALFLINKSDQLRTGFRIDDSNHQFFRLSAKNGAGIPELKETIWQTLNFCVIYLVEDNVEPNKNNPFVVQQGITLKDVGSKIGSEFADAKEGAKIWGNGAKFPGQEVSLTTQVQEGMMVRFI